MTSKEASQTHPSVAPVKGAPAVPPKPSQQKEEPKPASHPKSWADQMDEEDLMVFTPFMKDGKISEEHRSIFNALNSLNAEVRRGAVKGLLVAVRRGTKVSTSDLRAVAKDLVPPTVPLRHQPEKPKPGAVKAKPANAASKLRITELHALFPDFKTAGSDSEYAKIKKQLVADHKSGKTVVGPMPKTLNEYLALQKKSLA